MYQLNQDGTYAQRLGSGEWHHTLSSPEYLAWLSEGNTPQAAPTPDAPDYATLRRAAYAAEADPLYFMSQRGEATQADWLAKVAEIKARYPSNS